jgi:hemerythrin superfamily protein
MIPSHSEATELDVVDVLVTQHRKIEQLLAQVTHLDAYERADAFLALVTLLERHEASEEQVVHPITRADIDDGSQIAADRVAEEERADEALAGMRRVGVDDPSFEERFSQFRESVLAHAAAEKADEFARLRQAVPHETLVKMAEEVTASQAAMARAR